MINNKDIIELVKELQDKHTDFEFKHRSNPSNIGGNCFLRDGDTVIDISDNNMSVYEDCKFVQCDTECSCWDDVAAKLENIADFIDLSYKHFPSIAQALLTKDEQLKIAVEALEWNVSMLGRGGPEAKGQDALARHSQKALEQIRSFPPTE